MGGAVKEISNRSYFRPGFASRANGTPRRKPIRRRRSLSRILSSRPGSGSSSHSSGPPVARWIERPTRWNGRAARVRPCGRASLLLGLAPGGVYRASALTSGPGELLPHRFTVAPRPKARGCLFSVALSPDRSGPPLTATLPCGVRTFLPSREAASDCSTSSGERPNLLGARRPLWPTILATGLLALGAPEQHALAAGAEDHLLVALDLVEELRRDAYAAALADAAAHFDHGETAAAREDHLVLAPEVAVDRLHQLRARAALALDLGRQARERLAQLARLAVARRRQARQLGLETLELGRRGLRLFHDGHQLGLERTRLLLEQIDLALGQPELLVVADTGDAHPAVLHLGLGRGQASLEVALARAERRQLPAQRAGGGRLGTHGLFQRGDSALALGDGAGLAVQALIQELQRREDLDLRRQSPSVRRVRPAPAPAPGRRWWAQC